MSSPRFFLLAASAFLLIARSSATPIFLPSPGAADPTLVVAGSRAPRGQVGNPNAPAYRVPSLSVFDSVGLLATSLGWCSGALLSTRQHLLTAAHCFTDDAGNLAAPSATVKFQGAGGDLAIASDDVVLHPDWNGDVMGGADIAVVRLARPVGLPGYSLYRAAYFGLVTLAGYGRSGVGKENNAVFPTGILRAGLNSYEGRFDSIPGSPYGFDFDSGDPAQDTLGRDLGAGALEVMTAPGDSGGPTFFVDSTGRPWLLGLHSFRGRLGSADGHGPGDIDAVINSSFGEIGADTRVSFYAGWVDRMTIPEPGTFALLGAALLVLLRLARRRPRGTSAPYVISRR